MRTKQIEKMRENNRQWQLDQFWALGNSHKWQQYNHHVLALDDKALFTRKPHEIFDNVDYYHHYEDILPGEPTYSSDEDLQTRHIIATKDARLVSLLALQVLGYSRLTMASLDQLNAMLTHVYRHAIYAINTNPMYSIGYYWKHIYQDDEDYNEGMLTMGGHNQRHACQCPVPFIEPASTSKIKHTGKIMLVFYPIWQIAEYHWDCLTLDNMTPLAIARMASTGDIELLKMLR